MYLIPTELNVEGTRTGRFRSDTQQRSNTPKSGDLETRRAAPARRPANRDAVKTSSRN